MIEINGATEVTIRALKSKGAKVVKLASGKHAVTFKKDEALPQEKFEIRLVRKVRRTEGPPIKDLQEAARRKGIKNFRILHKDELIKILDSKTSQEEIDKIVAAAVVRWHTGFGKRSKHEK